jgi:hypothetical protein
MEPKPKLYNFSNLTPDVQRWCYRNIYAFDFTCDCIAINKDEIVTSVRMAIFLRVAQTMDIDDRLNLSRLNAIAIDNDLPKGAFNELTPAARWQALMWSRAIETAAFDCWAAVNTGETSAQVLQRLLSTTEYAMADNTPEEIACYWNFIDRWEPRTPGKVEFDSYLSLYAEDVA